MCAMSSVQDIEAALAALSREELEFVEKRAAEFKLRALSEPQAYAKEEYGLTEEELDRFEERMAAQGNSSVEKGQTTVFPGPFDPSCLD
jgi:hypothetical protein